MKYINLHIRNWQHKQYLVFTANPERHSAYLITRLLIFHKSEMSIHQFPVDGRTKIIDLSLSKIASLFACYLYLHISEIVVRKTFDANASVVHR